MPIINIPGVGKVRFPDEMSDKDIVDAIENNILKRPKEEPTFLQRAKAAAKRGLEEPVESVAGIGLGLKSALGMKEQASQQAAGIRYQATQPKEGPMPTTYEELEQTYGKEGAIEALKKFPTYVAEQILQSAPSMAAPLAVGAGAAALSGPAAPIVGPLAGLGTYGLQQFGQFMQRQAQEGTTGENLAPGKAAAVAAATAPLGYFADRFAFGLTKIPAKVLGEGALAELAKRTGASVAGRAATGASLGILAEAPTEVIEQIAERWQAGLPLDTEDARREYKEAFFGAAAVGGVGGAAINVLRGAPDIERRPGMDLLKSGQPPPVAPEQQTPEQVATLPPPPPFTPPPPGFTADQATQLRRESAMQEQARLQEQADAQQALQEQRQAQGARVAGLPGFTGMPDANQQIITQARADQAAQIKADENARKAAINRVMKTAFSADPVMQTIAQQRALEELGVTRVKANEITKADPAKQAELIEAEAPEFIPAERGQKKPRGETLFETPPEEKQEIADLRSGLTLVNKDLKEAQAGKGNLFSYLKGKLVDRPGAFSLADIDKDNKRLRQLYNPKGRGALLEDLVADGALDEYLPFNNRAKIGMEQNENFDSQTAIEHIAEKLRNGENINEESTVRLRDLQNQKEELKSRIEGLTSIPAANYELGQMAERPREELTEAGMRDLEDDARSIGVDVDSLREELSESMPSASNAEFYGAYQNALFAATSKSPSYSIEGNQYTEQEIETAIGERFTENEINELIAETEAQQTTATENAEVTEPAAQVAAPLRRADETKAEATTTLEKPVQGARVAKQGLPPILPELDKTPQGRHPQVAAAAKLRDEGKISREEFEEYVNAYKKIEPVSAEVLSPPAPDEQIYKALRGDKAKSRLNPKIKDGTRVGLRMDLPAREAGTNVVSIHEGKENDNPKTGKPYSSAGDVIGYSSAARITDVKFAPRDQVKSIKMAYLPEKNPLQTAEGLWVNESPQAIYDRVMQLMRSGDSAWTQVNFDPGRHGYFYNRKTADPVIAADELLQVGNFLLAKNVQYGQKQDFLYSQNGPGKITKAVMSVVNSKQAKMQKELTGKTMIEAAQWAVNNAPNPFAKLTASKTLAMLKELQGRGVTFNFEVQGGNERSSMLSGAEGVTHFLWGKEGTNVTVFLNGAPVFVDQRGYPSGMSHDTLLHELLHVATRTSTKFLPSNHPLIKDLNELFNTVVRKYNADAKAGKLPPILERYYKRINNVLATPDELISWGMNDKEFQKYLSEIKVGDKTVFSQLIDLVRKLIGMAKPFETALDRLVRTTEGLLELDTQYLQNEMVSQTYSLGKPAPVQKAKPIPMRQQALFQRSTPVMQDTLEVRREGFFFDAKNSPLYQKRSAEDIKYPTKEQTSAAIARNATARKIMQERGNVANGAYVGLRQDLNIKDANLLAVHQGKESLHEKGAGFFSGDVQTYLPVATLKNVYFKIRQSTREAIAEGREAKSKMGSADGQFVKTDQPNFDGIELRFNPRREHLFVDAMGRAVKYVDEATIIGGRAFARGNIEYYGEEDVPARAGQAPSAARLMQQGENQIKPIIDEPSGNVSIEQQQSLFMQHDAIDDTLQKRAEGFYIRADQSPLYQKRSASGMPQVTDDMFQRALAMHAKGARVEGKGSKIEPGDYVGVRLDVPIREASKKIFPPNGLPIQSIHKGTRSGIENSKGFFNNPVLKYAPNITIKNVHFKIDQAERAEIAAGRKKSPMGSADGQFVRIGEPNFDGIELGFNPKREHLFVDAFGRAIKYADEITAMGDRVYARGMIEYYGEEDIPSAGAVPTRAGPMVLETAIQEPVLKAVPDTNDGRVSDGQQQSLFSQQGIPSFDQSLVTPRSQIKSIGNVEDVALAEEGEYLTLAEKAKLYLSRNPNASRYNIIRFDDAHFFRQPDGRYTDDPVDKNTDMAFSSLFDVKKALNDYYGGTPVEKMLYNIGEFKKLKQEAKSAANESVPQGISESLSKQAAPTPTLIGQQSLEILSGMGREPKAPEPGYIQRVRQSWDNAVDNPKTTAQAAQSGFRRLADKIETYTMSSDAALNNEIQRKIMESTLGQEEKIGLLMNVSLSQTVHSDAISNLFLMKGDVKFNKKLSKWEGVDSEYNIVNLSKKLDDIAAKYGLTKEQIQLISHTAFESKRTKSLIQFNAQIDAEVEQLNAMASEELSNGEELKASVLREKASSLKMRQKYIHMTDEDVRAGMTQFELMPELSDAVAIWNGIRGNAVKTLVSSGLWTDAEAEFLLSNASYVPFYREDQLEQGKGPKEFMRSLQVQAKERRLKGTDRPVNDIFDNMVRWTQYSINRAVRNRSAVALAQTAESVGLATRVSSKSDGDNVISVWQDGGEVFYNMEDPMFMQAFQGLESISIPTIRWAAKVADVLRQSVVLYPLFSVAQIPQDSYAAMFSSGLKPQHALTIPFRAVKEFLLTLANRSKTHNELKNFGVVGVRDFTSAMVRNDAEVYAGLKAPPGMIGIIKNSLSHIAMASDNAVRQATYLAAQAQGLSQSEALEKAFEIFNVRRKGSSRMLAMAGQLIPFFNAYLAAQTVAYKTITGVGTSPTQRAEAYKVLFSTTASVMTLSVLYSMMNGDDEDYLNKPTPTRDRLLMIPGSGGMSIPLRSDLFTLPKVIAEHTYLLLTDNGYADGRKFRDSIATVLANAFLSPTAVPQAIKPLIEVGINYDFFQGKPLIGVFQKNLETERQFTDSTSELAKLLSGVPVSYSFANNQFEGLSPIAIDHLVRGMFGSIGGLVMYATNPFLWSDPNVPRPDLSLRNALSTIPNASGFISKEYEGALRKDFYQLREAVNKASSTLADLKQRSPDKIEDYITDEAVRNRLGLAPTVEGIARNLTKIRQAITRITNSEMPSDEKAEEIRNLRKAEREMLKGVNLKEMREFAKI